MTHNNLKLILITTLVLVCMNLVKAQVSINTSGNDASGSGGSVAYSIGQIAYTTNKDTTGSLSQGVQQAYDIFMIGLKEPIFNTTLSVFPNPTSNNLTLHISQYNNEKLTYQLWDMQGKLLANGHVTTQQTQINTSGWAAATYFIHIVNQDNQKIQSFKIVKKQNL
jgi:hypothetical protein